MTRTRLLATGFLSIALLGLSACKDNSANGNGESLNSVFEPPDGDALFILGQADEDAMRDYISEVNDNPLPAGYAFYTSLSGNATASDMGRYIRFLDDYQNSTLQLAIWTGERQWGDPGYYLDDIVAGRYDSNIETLAEACMSIDKPIYIRFGYEFDGWHNAYPPDKYKAAYTYFVDAMRDHGVTNVAYVWHSWGVDAYYGHDDFPEYYPELENQVPRQDLWYPGDDYVDWVGLSVFGTGWGDLSENIAIQWLINFAKQHDKPVMLAETAAIKTSEQSDPSWVIPNSVWFENVFNLINDNDAVKAFTYINVDWEGDNPSSTWGDTRIQAASSSVMNYWLEHIEPFLHADEELYSIIGYEN